MLYTGCPVTGAEGSVFMLVYRYQGFDSILVGLLIKPYPHGFPALVRPLLGRQCTFVLEFPSGGESATNGERTPLNCCPTLNESVTLSLCIWWAQVSATALPPCGHLPDLTAEAVANRGSHPPRYLLLAFAPLTKSDGSTRHGHRY